MQSDDVGSTYASATSSSEAPSVSREWNLRSVFCSFARTQAGLYRGMSLATSEVVVRLYETFDPVDDLQ
jgi:hypothetical protein